MLKGTLGKLFSGRHTEILFLFFPETGYDISCKLYPFGDNLNKNIKAHFRAKIKSQDSELIFNI